MTRIMHLDDDQTMLNLVRITLELEGYDIVSYDDSEKALQALRTDPFDLLIQDVARPGIDGISFYQIMKSDKALKDIPVIFLSAGVLPDFAEECASVYGDLYRTKPVSFEMLKQSVADILTRHGKYVPTDEDRAARRDYLRARYPKHFDSHAR